MKYKCSKCNSKFSSEYLLNKHMNKKTPCTEKIQCNICGLEFKGEIYLERHKNRKTPCVKNQEKIPQTTVVINNDEKQKTRLKIEKEKTKQLELKLELKLKEKEMEIQAQKELKLLEIEALKLRNESRIKEEELKTERKEKTVHTINNTQIINIQNNFIQNMEEKYAKDDKVVCLDTSRLRKFQKYVGDKINSHEDNELNIYLFNTSKSSRDFIITIFKSIFNNEKFPKMRFLFYNKELDRFYGIFKNLDNREVRQIDYEKYIDVLFKPILIQLCDNMKEYCDKSKENTNMNCRGYSKYIDITEGRKYTLDSLENISKDILDEGTTLSIDEYKNILLDYEQYLKKLEYY